MLFRSLFRGCAFPSAWPLRSYASSSPQSSKIRRILRKNVSQLPPAEQLRPCISASKCQRYDLAKITSILEKLQYPSRVVDGGEALWTEFPREKDVMVLANGTVVGWNFSEPHVIDQLVPMFGPAEIEPYANVETEDMDFVEEESSDTQSGMIGDVIYVHGPTKSSRLMDKLAFSSGMARHTKLSALEVTTEKIIQQVKVISSSMASGNRPNLSVRQVDVLTGRLLQIRGSLNLYSTITETPDIYWSQPQQESLYEVISKSLDVEPRIEILNKKLDYAADMVSILRQHLSERTSLRVEWMILILILVEVGFELKKYIPFFSSEEETTSPQHQ